ncbi:MAG: hypothetical protein KUG79_14165 [Pseudomonadales bacterium]|nr:hypothetical protein [Pseudomonadales bacterium]
MILPRIVFLGLIFWVNLSLAAPLPPELVAALNHGGDDLHAQQWLNWHTDFPEKLGKSVWVNEPLQAGAEVDIKRVITLGSDISVGGGILVAKHWQHTFVFQTQDSTAANFVRISADATDVEWTAKPYRSKGILGGLKRAKPQLLFSLVRGSLKAGDSVTVEYVNLQLPTRAEQEFQPGVYFKQHSDGGFFPVPADTMDIKAGKVALAEVLVPSLIKTSQPFKTRVLLKDQFGNLANGSTPSFDILVDGTFHSRIESSLENYHVINNLQFDVEGKHTISVKSSGGGITASSNPFWVDAAEQRILWGNSRHHTRLGDGLSPAANTDPALDFSITSVHGSYYTDQLYAEIVGPKAWVWTQPLQSGGAHQVITDRQISTASQQTSLVRGLAEANTKSRSIFDTIMVALPEPPVDDRFIDNQLTRLVELISGDSHFEWFANKLLSRGYRLGFTASAHSHLDPTEGHYSTALTALIVEPNESVLAALHRGSTYITTGEKILLRVQVDATGVGKPLSSKKTVTKTTVTKEPIAKEPIEKEPIIVRGLVSGTAAIHRIELLKNGVVIDTIENAADSDSGTIMVSFKSQSRPYKAQRDLPRNGREWLGYFKVTDAEIITVNPLSMRPGRQRAIAVNPKTSNRVDFITWTRGTSSSFLLDLAAVNENAIFEINLRAGHEDEDSTPLRRSSTAIPASRQLINLSDVRQQRVDRKIRIKGYADEISVEMVNSAAASQLEFEFVDKTPRVAGDYYYIRVTQLDDARAWSSPVFVGGFEAP